MRPLLPLLLLAVACTPERPPSALAVTLNLPVAAECIVVEAVAPGARETTRIEPTAGEAPRLRYVVAIYPGGPLGAGNVTLRATGFSGSCSGEPFLGAQADTRFPARGIGDVVLNLAPLSEDGDGDGVPDVLDCAPSDVSRYPRAGPEQGTACGNGVDDDCDGLAEDGCPCTAPRSCYPSASSSNAGIGVCARGTQACVDGAYENGCTGAVLPSGEQCDGVDTDCDGILDPPGCGCDTGATRSCYEVGPPLDAGVGRCVLGTQACVGGTWESCQGDVAPEPESCNGLDDDCDGAVDERPDVPTPPCALQAGVCLGAKAACLATLCVGSDYALAASGRGKGFVPAEGLSECDGFDNDCDGVVDEGCPCEAGASEPCHPLGLSFPGLDAGTCSVGARTCQADAGWGACVGAVSPTAELCNGKDDDCDGTVDDSPADAGTPCPVPGLGVCAVGTWACTNGALACGGAPSASPELCNGRDDDCDGTTDELFTLLGQPCDAGIGACARAGSISCLPDGTEGCSVVAGSPVSELCNGLDDDCDGAPDEDFSGLGTLCTLGSGGCLRSGTLVCLPDGGSGCNAEVVLPQPEICNGKDDNCDSVTDEGFPGLNTLCQVGVGACQRNGNITCYPDGGSGCDHAPGLPAAETCNGADDDCNGTVDDNIPGMGTVPCSVGVGACARAGTNTCVGGIVGCSVAAGSPIREVCNGQDDDCDGQTDEQPECGGPRADVAESAASTWTTTDGAPGYPNFAFCTGSGQVYSGVVSSTLAYLVGANSARLNYGTDATNTGAGLYTGVYPAGRNGSWDLSTTTGLTFASLHYLPGGISWEASFPVVALCSAGGGYRTFTPNFQVLNASWVRSLVPLAGDTSWTANSTPNFDPTNVSFIEFHMDPKRSSNYGQVVVWLDDVRFY